MSWVAPPKLVEIEARFQARLQAARVELEEPDFTFPANEISSRHRKKTANIWSRISSRYQYAKKINELSSKYGRIQPMTHDLESLVDRFPTSAGLRRHLAYFYFLLGREKDALVCYRRTAAISKEASDWHNVAALALRTAELPFRRDCA